MNYGEETDKGGGVVTKQTSPTTKRKRGLPSTQKNSNSNDDNTLYKRRGVSKENDIHEEYGSRNDSSFNPTLHYKPPEQKNGGLDLSVVVTKSNETLHNNIKNNTNKQVNTAAQTQKSTKPRQYTSISKHMCCTSTHTRHAQTSTDEMHTYTHNCRLCLHVYIYIYTAHSLGT